jgi:hypothetical protein
MCGPLGWCVHTSFGPVRECEWATCDLAMVLIAGTGSGGDGKQEGSVHLLRKAFGFTRPRVLFIPLTFGRFGLGSSWTTAGSAASEAYPDNRQDT